MKRLTPAAPAANGFFRSVLKPLFFSFLITLLSLLVLSACIAFGPVTENAAEICILLSTAISIFIGALLFANARGSRGLLAGLVLGVLYTGIACLIAVIGFGSISLGIILTKRLPLALLCGAIGGIMGVNSRKKRH